MRVAKENVFLLLDIHHGEIKENSKHFLPPCIGCTSAELTLPFGVNHNRASACLKPAAAATYLPLIRN
jgi:hypothetical protein